METPNGTTNSEHRRRTGLPPYYVIREVPESYLELEYYVFRVYGPDDKEVSAKIIPPYLSPSLFVEYYYAIRLSYFIRPDCVDSEIEGLLGKLLDEGQFKELMVNHIRRCFKSKRAINSRLEKLENFMNMKLGRMRFPAIIYHVSKDGLSEYSYLFSLKVGCVYQHFAPIGVLQMFKDGFCHPTLYVRVESMACFPYDPEDIDVGAVAKMGKYGREIPIYLDTVRSARSRMHEWLCKYCAECQDAGFREWVESRLEKAEQVLSYVLFLTEMLKR